MLTREKAMEIYERWQRSWDADMTGRELYRSCAEVGKDLLKLSFKAVQMLTGHGNMKEHLVRFGLREGDGMCGAA